MSVRSVRDECSLRPKLAFAPSETSEETVRNERTAQRPLWLQMIPVKILPD